MELGKGTGVEAGEIEGCGGTGGTTAWKASEVEEPEG